MKIAVLFPGQGAQYAGMGKTLYDNSKEGKEIYDRAAANLSWDLREVCFQDQEGKLNQTRYTQAALFTTNVAIYEAIKDKISVDAVLGFSLGEYSAIYASGALSFEQTLELVERRGAYMEACAQNNPGGMVAVIGLAANRIYEVCEQINKQTVGVDLSVYVSVANDNCDGQVTVSGTLQGIEKATEALKEAGAKRIIPIKVSGAFHSQLMKEAADHMSEEVANLELQNPLIPIVSNVTAREMVTANEIKENIPLQIVNGVRFRESILNLGEQGYDLFIEVGPKNTLSNLVKKILPNAKTLQVEDVQGIEHIMEEIRNSQ